MPAEAIFRRVFAGWRVFGPGGRVWAVLGPFGGLFSRPLARLAGFLEPVSHDDVVHDGVEEGDDQGFRSAADG